MDIATRFQRTVVALALAGLTIIALDHVWLNRRILEGSLERRATAIAGAVSEIAEPTLRSGTPLDAEALQSFGDLQGINTIVVRDSDGNVLLTVHSKMEAHRKKSLFRFVSPIQDELGPLGQIELVMSKEHIEDASSRLLMHISILSALLLALLGAACTLLGRRLGEYLTGFAEAVRRMSPTSLPPIPARFKGSELDVIETAFKNLSARLNIESALRAEATRAKDEMAAMVVHDLKHPLTVLNTLLLIQRDPELNRNLGHRSDEHHRMAMRAMSRLSAMIDDVLHIARLSNAQTELRKESLSLESLFEEFEVENRLVVEASGRRFCLSLSKAARSLRVYANAAMIKRVVGNLVLNAIEHSPEDAQITLGLDLSVAHPGRVELWVHNTGSLIPPEEMRKVFERYFTSNKHHHNIGLGLTFCKLAADAHGAILSGTSSEGGTRFALTMSYMSHEPPGDAARGTASADSGSRSRVVTAGGGRATQPPR